jgi:hypothetical protein
MSRYLLRFIGGKYEGGQVALPDAGEVGIGRAQELQICLVEDMVSRHHAKIEVLDGRVILTDLNSTNGTFVNGERVQKCEIEHQDRVLFGTSILRLEDTSLGPTEAPSPDSRPTTPVAPEAMSGDLTDVSLSDLLQLLGGNGRTGTLTLQAPEGEGQVVLTGGRVQHVSASPYGHMAPLKVLCRMLLWREGQFAFADGPTPVLDGQAEDLGRTDEALMEAARLNDEAQRACAQLGGLDASAQLMRPLGGKLAHLDPRSLEILQRIWDTGGALRPLADGYDGADSVLFESIWALVQQGFVQLAPAPTPAR